MEICLCAVRSYIVILFTNEKPPAKFFIYKNIKDNLGIPEMATTQTNRFIPIPTMEGKKVLQVACSDFHTLCVLDSGEVYTWGGQLHKKLGQR
jgi:alpha-tubulin suppressor-like RCC1 family protein